MTQRFISHRKGLVFATAAPESCKAKHACFISHRKGLVFATRRLRRHRAACRPVSSAIVKAWYLRRLGVDQQESGDAVSSAIVKAWYLRLADVLPAEMALGVSSAIVKAWYLRPSICREPTSDLRVSSAIVKAWYLRLNTFICCHPYEQGFISHRKGLVFATLHALPVQQGVNLFHQPS